MNKIYLKQALDSFKNLNIAVIGDMMIDDYLIGTVDRISPEAPVPVVSVKEEKFVLGGAANVVNNLSTLGAKVISFGVIGNDFSGNLLINELESKGIDISGIIKTTDRPTIVKRRIIGGSQQLLRLDWEDIKPITTDLENKIITELKNQINTINAVILSDYDKGLLTPTLVKEIISICKKNNIIVIVDPKPKNALNYVGSTSMTPNRKEALACVNANPSDDIVEVGKKIIKKLELDNLLLTRSEEGMTIFKENSFTNIPTFAKDVFDVTGAGDTVISVYTLGCASGLSIEEAAKIANTAAGVVVGKIGTSTVTAEEIINFYGLIYPEKD